MDKNQVDIQNDFEKYLKQVFLKNLTYILVAGSLILLYYMYSDFIVRENLQAAATRLLPYP
ncbi:hypothetical protein [Marinilabilia salmonicolor]|uniref:hypothetical protein n=1 Tax=Marinilabilia salmonicolor TaxID=989 RepID=UPI000469D6D0|nr:hypothetical protein [Marinilabilia salmonicolor]